MSLSRSSHISLALAVEYSTIDADLIDCTDAECGDYSKS